MIAICLLMGVLAPCQDPAPGPGDPRPRASLRTGDIEREARLREALDALEGGRAADRFLAGRYLARHVRPGDGRTLLTGVQRGGPETRLRLVDALGGEDRHILVAAELIDPQVGLPTPLGTDILVELILRWNPEFSQPPLSRSQLLAILGEHRVHDLHVTLPSSLDAGVDALARSGMLGAPLVLDPGLAAGVRRGGRQQPASVFRGTWELVLDQLVLGRGATWEAFGFHPPGTRNDRADEGSEKSAGEGRPFFRICLKGSEGREPAVEHLLHWCTQIVGQGSLPQRTAAARALAACGWPAALLWLESRAETDGAARAGLVLAASQGRLSPWFFDASRVAGLLASVDLELSEDAPGSARHAEELAAALGHLPAHTIAPGNGSPVGLLLEGWDALDPRSLWVRLVALEGVQPAVAGLRGRVQALAVDASRPAGLRIQALRLLAALPDPPQESFPIGHLAPLLERARSRDAEPELSTALASAGAVWARAEGDLSSPDFRSFLLSWSLTAGDRDGARAALSEGLASGLPEVGPERLPESWSSLLDVLEARSAALDRAAMYRLLKEAFGEENRERWPAVFDRCALRSGCSGKEGDLRLLKGQLAPQETGRMLCSLAHEEARVVILDALGRETGSAREAWLEGVQAGVQGLWARMQDAAAEHFLEQVREALGEGDEALGRLIRSGVWPPRPAAGAVRVDLMVRSL